MIKHYHFIFISLFFSGILSSQEIKQFSLSDFDLNGNVKTCQVITDYGQEIFEFDVLGRLVKATTKYNEQDKDITTYKFEKDNLVEKRVESYKDNVLDLSSSMAHFYIIDSTAALRIKEQILSYDKEFVEVQEYQFNEEEQLYKIIVSHENAVDEVDIESSTYKNENTKTYFENGIIQKSVRKSIKSNKRQGQLDVTLTKTYLDGEPNQAVEELMNSKGLLVSREIFQFSTEEKEFVSIEKHQFEYDSDEILTKETIQQGNSIAGKEYIFQFDNNEEKNWVKKIITPDNTFTTRKLTYYPKDIVGLKVDD